MYTIVVAAVNSAGSGEYSDHIVFETAESEYVDLHTRVSNLH